MILSGVVFGLTSSLTFGILDILIISTSRTTGVLQSLVIAQAISAGILLLYLLQIFVSGISPELFFTFLLVGCVIGAVNTLANLSLYKGLELGPIAVVSPISASYGLVTSLLALFIFHEILFPVQYLAITLIALSFVLSSLKGVKALVVSARKQRMQFLITRRELLTTQRGFLTVLLGFRQKQQRMQFFKLSRLFLHTQRIHARQYKGLFFGIVSMFCFGLEFFGISIATEHFGPLQPILWSRLCSVFFLLFYASRKPNYAWKEINLKQLGVIALIGVLDTIGMAWYDLGTGKSATSIVAALSSTYTLLPTLVGVVVYHERLPLSQWIWIGLLISGILLFSLPIH